ncbi:MAG TPA: insulinase family protein, partial [Parvularculaceae bacterium]|nr:insulinase family protein [Parvularculaceae bacterium]
ATPSYVGGAAHDARAIEQTHIAAAFPGVGSRHQDFFAMRVFAEALGGGMASRLFQTIREERGLAYSVYAHADCYDDVGALGAYIGADAEHALEAVELLRREIEDAAEALSAEEAARARAVLTSTLLMGLENPAGRIEMAAGQIFTFGAALSPAEMRGRLNAVTIDDARRCAERALSGPASLAIVGEGDLASIAKAVGAPVSRG